MRLFEVAFKIITTIPQNIFPKLFKVLIIIKKKITLKTFNQFQKQRMSQHHHRLCFVGFHLSMRIIIWSVTTKLPNPQSTEPQNYLSRQLNHLSQHEATKRNSSGLTNRLEWKLMRMGSKHAEYKDQKKSSCVLNLEKLFTKRWNWLSFIIWKLEISKFISLEFLSIWWDRQHFKHFRNLKRSRNDL